MGLQISFPYITKTKRTKRKIALSLILLCLLKLQSTCWSLWRHHSLQLQQILRAFCQGKHSGLSASSQRRAQDLRGGTHLLSNLYRKPQSKEAWGERKGLEIWSGPLVRLEYSRLLSGGINTTVNTACSARSPSEIRASTCRHTADVTFRKEIIPLHYIIVRLHSTSVKI